jgi:hypothetical protein
MVYDDSGASLNSLSCTRKLAFDSRRQRLIFFKLEEGEAVRMWKIRVDRLLCPY